jgi:two-component system nitrate/nitrite response regulator NarL
VNQNPFRVLIIADDPLARAGLSSILGNNSEYIVTGSLSLSDLTQGILNVYQADVILWDVGWLPDHPNPDESATDAEMMLEVAEHGTPIIALLADESQFFEVLRMGIRGLLDRNASESELAAAIKAVLEGFMVIKPEWGSRIFPSEDGMEILPSDPLTARETEVIQLIAQGLPNKVIAQRLGISEHTVKFHVNAILRKLDAQSRTEAVVRAYRLGIILI